MERLRRALRGTDLPVGEALHPLTLLSVILLIVNDWVLKRHFPGLVTGKLSDVAGLIFAPVVLSSVIGLVLLVVRVNPWLTHRRLLLCIAATGITFAAVKISPDAARLLADLLPRGSHIAVDRTDLFTLPALAVAYYIGRDELKRLAKSRLPREMQGL